jgi:hypothetical protein
MVWNGLNWLRIGTSCEHGNEPSGSIRCWQILEYLASRLHGVSFFLWVIWQHCQYRDYSVRWQDGGSTTGKRFEMEASWPNQRPIPAFASGAEEPTKIPSQERRCPGRDSNQASPEYKSGMLTCGPNPRFPNLMSILVKNEDTLRG